MLYPVAQRKVGCACDLKNGVGGRSPIMEDARLNVTFDSNTVEHALGVKGEALYCQNLAGAFARLRQAIEKGRIVPYVSEGYFTVEAILKKSRKKEMGRPAKSSSHVYAVSENEVGISMIFGPAVSVELPPQFEAVYKRLKELGGFVLPVNRFGWPVCKMVQELYPKFDTGGREFDAYNQKSDEVSRFIEDEIGGGLKFVKEQFKKDILSNPIPLHRDNPMYRELVRDGATNILFSDNNLSDKKIAKHIAEISDCDMVSSHIAFGNDVLCTLDRSKGQGISGILHADNLSKLRRKYPIRICSPVELVEVCNR